MNPFVDTTVTPSIEEIRATADGLDKVLYGTSLGWENEETQLAKTVQHLREYADKLEREAAAEAEAARIAALPKPLQVSTRDDEAVYVGRPGTNKVMAVYVDRDGDFTTRERPYSPEFWGIVVAG